MAVNFDCPIRRAIDESHWSHEGGKRAYDVEQSISNVGFAVRIASFACLRNFTEVS